MRKLLKSLPFVISSFILICSASSIHAVLPVGADSEVHVDHEDGESDSRTGTSLLDLPPEMLAQIASHLDEKEDLKNLSLTDTNLKDLSQHAFLKKLPLFKINDVSELKKLHDMNAFSVPIHLKCKATDEILGYLKYFRNILFSSSADITDAGLAHLKNATTVHLHCNQITDTGLAHLENAKNVSLFQGNQITDAGLAHLKNAKSVNLFSCNQISDAGLAHLENVATMFLTGNNKISSAARQALRDKGVKVCG